MNYPESVQYLYALGNELKVGAKLGLETMQLLLTELGHPERGQRFVHVAGTNGKGSTCAMIANSLRQAGLRVGLYTSPHLIEPTERIQLNGIQVSREEFTRAFDFVHSAAEALLNRGTLEFHPSYFETVTAMALVIFRGQCDISVMEVGLGGRLDATNVITPELCVITPVAFDHESFLGNTLEAIAAEKAGILKSRVPAILAKQAPAVTEVIAQRASQLGCSLTRSEETSVAIKAVDPDGSTFQVDEISYRCALPGRHQIENALTAILASRNLNVPDHEVQAGLENVRWPGRLEFIARHPTLILDGAHNPAGAAALAAYIREFWSNAPVWLVYGAMRDKAIEEITDQLFPLASRVILTAPNFARAIRPDAIAAITRRKDALLTQTVEEAIAIAASAPRDAVVFFAGSLFVVGEARGLLLRDKAIVS